MNKKEKQKLFEEIKEKIIKGINPNAIYVFGSFAIDKETQYSDIDLLIEKETEVEIQKRFGLVRKYLKGIPFPFDILVYTPKEMKQKIKNKYSVVFQAIQHGIKIYEK